MPLLRRGRTFAIVRFALVTTVAWTVFGFFDGYQVYINNVAAGIPNARFLGPAMVFSLVRAWLYAVATPLVFFFSQRFSFSPGKRVQSVMGHLVGFVCFDAFYIALRYLLYPPIDVMTQRFIGFSLEHSWDMVRSTLFQQGVTYLCLTLIFLAARYNREQREREVREADLQRRVAEYELQILKLQLHPHFLFNTLNGISTMMSQDVGIAREMLIRLSDLLRLALDQNRAREVTLKDELDFIEAYLDLEKVRFGERLRFNFAVDPQALDAAVPNMILQPLVENAVRHGIAPRREGGRLEIAAERDVSDLVLRVRNDGPPLDEARVASHTGGLGLGNTRARLVQAYGEGSRFKIANRPQGGVEVSLRIPFREMTEEMV